jgi:hypothetical protein
MTDRMRVSGGVYTAPVARANEVDPLLIVAEMRAGDLLIALQSAVAGDAHWRMRAQALLREIARGVLPEYMTEALRTELREVDSRKRAAEIATDIGKEQGNA